MLPIIYIVIGFFVALVCGAVAWEDFEKYGIAAFVLTLCSVWLLWPVIVLLVGARILHTIGGGKGANG